MPPTGWLKAMRELCRELDILFVADEVITGFGRTGPLFACDGRGRRARPDDPRQGPDLGLCADGRGAHVRPVYRRHRRRRAGDAPIGHGSTYSAHPVSAAVALEVLRLYEGGVLANGLKAGARLMAGLDGLADHPLVGDVRGRGMLAAIELVADKAQQDAASRAADAGPAHLRQGVGQWPDHPRLRQRAFWAMLPRSAAPTPKSTRSSSARAMTLDQTLDDPDVRQALA